MEILRIEDLSFSYPTDTRGRNALEHVSFSVNDGEFVLLCGRSGSGKSTLLNLLKKETAPSGKKHGEIIYSSSEDITVGLLSQDPDRMIVSDKVIHELSFAPENMGLSTQKIRRRISEISAYFGMDTWIDEDTDKLSGGRKQILCIASVLAMRPKLLLLDEPMGSLDPLSCTRLKDVLIRLNRELGMTVIVAEHFIDRCLEGADRVIALDEGRVIYDGTPESAASSLRKTALYKAFPAPAVINEALGLGLSSEQLNVKGVKAALQGRSFRKVGAQVTAKDGDELLSAQGLYFSYEKHSGFVLRGTDISLRRGSIYACMGANGCGKSTLIKCLAGVLKPQKGRLKKSTTSAYLPQDAGLLFLGETVMGELERAASSSGAASEMAQRLGLSEYADMHPYDLSGGRRTLLGMGMIILSGAGILLLDEPTLGMDCECKELLSIMLSELKKDKAILLVSHDVEFIARTADMACMFFDGSTTVMAPVRQMLLENNYITTCARLIAGDSAGTVTTEELIEAYHEG